MDIDTVLFFVICILLLICFGIAGIIVSWLIAHSADQLEQQSVPVQRWPRPETEGQLPEGAVRFMQVSMRCCFCHSGLYPGPTDGVAQTFYCGNPACNSAFHFLIFTPNNLPLLPWGEFTGECPLWFINGRKHALNLYPKERS